jgi:hypothetical protein
MGGRNANFRPAPRLYFMHGPLIFADVELTVDTFAAEIAAALKSYDRHIVCLEKLPEECEASLRSLMQKAVNAYVNRGADMRHGIALDRHVTIILSQTDDPRPLCGIYFNLHSPYSRKSTAKAGKELA